MVAQRRANRERKRNMSETKKGATLVGDRGNAPLTMRLWPEAGTALGLSRNQTYAAARAGQIAVIKFGKLYRVPTAALHRMLDRAGGSE